MIFLANFLIIILSAQGMAARNFEMVGQRIQIFWTRLASTEESPTDKMTAQSVVSAHNVVATATSA